MTVTTINESQRNAAKIIGFCYLFALVPAIFAEFYVRANLIIFNNASQTSLNIIAHERLFRLGIASNLIVFAVDIILIFSLYMVLKPINRALALFATGWGIIETAILVIVSLNDLDVLRILSSADYLKSFEASQVQTLANLSVGAHDSAYNVGLVFAGLRSTTFCYLWLKSGFIPRFLAAWGIFASFLMGTCVFLFIIFPEFVKVIPIETYGGPIFLFELIMGFWLLFKKLKPFKIYEVTKVN